MKLFSKKIVLLAGCLILGGVVFVIAQDDPFVKLTYPIPELGNCADKKSCEAYCDKLENMKFCVDFAETHNLLPKEEIETAQRMLALGQAGGPGGCKTRESCEAYCDQIDNIKECIIFAEQNNLIPEDELQEAKKVMQAIDRGLTPPKCKGKKECDVYCSKPENMEGCINFAKEAGLMQPEEFQEAEKVLEAIKKGAKPPACSGKKECDIYCSQPEHMEECMEFGIAAGFIPPEEMENVKKTLKAIKQGVRPPNCQGEKECDVYCSQPEHMEECMEFGIAAGFIPPEEIEGARGTLRAMKQGLKPPACQGKEECDIYCSQSEHIRECMEFSIAAGFMPPEEIENAKKTLEAIKKGVMPPNCKTKEECDIYCSQEEHREECINFSEAAGFISSEDAQRAREGGGDGPGGCETKEECEAFCSKPENTEICIDFSVKRGDISPEEAEKMRQGAAGQTPAGPGGCKTPEECQAFCQKPENANECMQFVPQGESGKPPAVPEGGISGLPQGFEGKCGNPEGCMQYCSQNFQDPACQTATGFPGGTISPSSPMPEGQMPPPEGAILPLPEGQMPQFPPPQPSPENQPQSFFYQVKYFLADIISALDF